LEFFFNELSNISKQTAILESLDWSDEKLQEVLSVCAKSISEMEADVQKYSSPDMFRDKISKDLEDLLSEDQVNSVLGILNDIISQSLEGIMSDGN
jgi:hypothetical protein